MTFPGDRTTGNVDIDNILVQEANRINEDVLRHTTHISPWIDLISKGVFPSGMGYQLNQLVYDRVLPRTPHSTYDTVGVSWADLVGSSLASSNDNIGTGIIEASSPDRVGPNDTATLSRVEYTKLMRQYNLERAVIRSPEIHTDDLRFAAHASQQLGAIIELLSESVRWSWEQRHRDEYMRLLASDQTNGLAGCVIECAASTTIQATQTAAGSMGGAPAGSIWDGFDNGEAGGGTSASVLNISNAILDRVYTRLVRHGAGMGSWGNESGRPVFGLVCSSEASYGLLTESEYRTDVRESPRVSELLAALGVNKSLRGFYHIIDDLAPRYNVANADDTYYDRAGNYVANGDYYWVPPYTINAAGRIIPNDDYENATHEVAIVLHQNFMESLIPEPLTGMQGIVFDPVNYRGDFRWVNIAHEDKNPDRTIGHFRAILSSASKPKKLAFGYALIYQRAGVRGA